MEQLSDEEIAGLVANNEMKDHELEKRLDAQRAVVVRRLAFESKLSNADALSDLPHEHYDYKRVLGANCEIVVGYVPIRTEHRCTYPWLPQKAVLWRVRIVDAKPFRLVVEQ